MVRAVATLMRRAPGQVASMARQACGTGVEPKRIPAVKLQTQRITLMLHRVRRWSARANATRVARPPLFTTAIAGRSGAIERVQNQTFLNQKSSDPEIHRGAKLARWRLRTGTTRLSRCQHHREQAIGPRRCDPEKNRRRSHDDAH